MNVSKVEARFFVKSMNHIHNTGNNDPLCEITLGAHYNNGKGGNKAWSKYTPSGEIKMLVTNPAAIEFSDPPQDA